MNTLLLVDDNKQYIENFKEEFSGDFFVKEASAQDLLGDSVSQYFEGVDAILIDLFMPEIDGLSLWRHISQNVSTLPPAFMLSESFLPNYREMALKLGMQDFLHKEMSKVEIILRVQNWLKPVAHLAYSPSVLSVLELDLLMDQMSCQIGNKQISLTKTEFRILRELFGSEQKSLNRYDLMEKVWSGRTVIRQTLNTHLFNLNDKLKSWSQVIFIDKDEVVRLKEKDWSNEAMAPKAL